MCNERFDDPRERILMKNIAYAGSLVAALDIDMPIVEDLLAETFAGKASSARIEPSGFAASATTTRRSTSPARLPFHLEKMEANDDKILIDGNTATALGCRVCRRDGCRLVSDHSGDLGDGCLQAILRKIPRAIPKRAATTTASCKPKTNWPPSAW